MRENPVPRAGRLGRLVRVTHLAALTVRSIAVGDPADRPLLADWVTARAASARHDLGRYASPFTLEEYLAFSRYEAFERFTYAGVLGDAVVAAGAVTLPRRDNLTSAYLILDVLPRYRRHGVGSALLDRLESVAMEHGRTSLMAETTWLQGGRDEAGEEFLGPRGYGHALTSIQSDLELSSLPSAELGMLTAPADGYVVEWAEGALPEAWLDDRAVLTARMSTDAPSGDLDLAEEVWDADRVRASVGAELAAGRWRVEAVARHLRSGRLVGYTQVAVSPDTPALAYQEDTLVINEHRGHGLGARMKAVTAAVLRERRPEVTPVRTWNATTNEHMLAVNRAMGFRPVAFDAEWQKRVG